MEFYSLQVGNKTENGIPQPYRKEITDLGSNLRDFRDTTSAISQLDLVISVDTSVAHLAGAMGKKFGRYYLLILTFVGCLAEMIHPGTRL